jgi:hypothetical protein
MTPRYRPHIDSHALISLKCHESYFSGFWSDLSAFVSTGSFKITHLNLQINIFTLMTCQKSQEFTEAMKIFKSTVTSIILDLRGCSRHIAENLRIIQQEFSCLKTLQFHRASFYQYEWILIEPWHSRGMFGDIVFSKCCTDFHLISEFIKEAYVAHSITLHQCYPLDAAGEVAVLRLDKGRSFRHLDIQTEYRDGPFVKSVSTIYV